MKTVGGIYWKRIAGAICILLGILIIVGCVRERNPVTGRKQFYGMSWDQEEQIGKQSNQEIIQQYGLYKDPQVQAYVRRVGQQVLSKSDLRKPGTPAEYRNTPFTFQVLDSEVVNAFATPGGYIYVTRGLLTHLENEAQLAVVLGHEVGHVAARHSATQAMQSQLGQIGLAAGALIGAQVMGNPQAAGQLMQAGSGALQLLSLKYSRGDETEADELGVRYAEHSGYDATQGAGFFESLKRISQKEGDRLPTFLSTHPDPGGREKRIIELAQQYRGQNEMAAVNRKEFLQHVDGMVVGENPRNGFVRNSMFYHPDLRFQFPVPSGWKVNNENAGVTLLGPQKNAVMIFEPAPGQSPQQAASQFANQQGIKVLNTSQTKVNGFNAVALTAQANTQQGAAGLLSYFIGMDNHVYNFMGLTSASQLDNYSRQFQQVFRGFQRVTDSQILNVKPAQIALVRADRAAPFTSFLPTGTLAGMSPEDLAILNQVKLNEQVPAGTILKIPRSP